MARSARGRRSFRRRRVDWVQNDITYSEQQTNMAPGNTNATAGILVHSSQVRRYSIGADTPTSPARPLMSAAFPQWDRKQVVVAVRGTIEWYPIETWSTTATRNWGFRLTKMVEDPGSQLPMVPIDYNMYGLNPPPVAGDETEPYLYADDPFLWERREARSYNSQNTSPVWVTPVNWRGRCYLEEDECLCMYFESDLTLGSSGEVALRTWLRALVEVPTT